MADEDDISNALAFSRVRHAVDQARAANVGPDALALILEIFDEAVDNLPLDVTGWTREAWLLAIVLVAFDSERWPPQLVGELVLIGVLLDEVLT